MDIAALIFAPLLLALIYSWSGINRLPRIARVGLPVGLLAVLFIAFIGYAPAIQEAVATRTPLVRQIEGLPLTFHVDGVALLFGLIITGVGAMMTSAASGFYEDVDAYRRFVRLTMILCSVMLGLVLADYLMLYALLYITFFALTVCVFIERDRRRIFPRWMFALLIILSGVFLLGMTALQWAGAEAKQFQGALQDMSLLSRANLSSRDGYVMLIGLILGPMLVYACFVLWRWLRSFEYIQPIDGVLASALIIGHLYFVVRFYAALQDHPLWWGSVTGAGLIIMLVGSVWSLRSGDLRQNVMCITLSIIGTCVALLGLPDYLGVYGALVTMMVYALAFSVLFLSLDQVGVRKIGWTIALALSALAVMVVDVWTIAAFYTSPLPGAGIVLAMVVLNIALLSVSSMDIAKVILRWRLPDGHTQRFMSLQLSIGMLLAVASLVSIPLFNTLLIPLLNSTIIREGPSMDLPALLLSLLAWGGGLILLITQPWWQWLIDPPPLNETWEDYEPLN